MTSKYAVLQEVNDTEVETWLYFIKYEGNEDNLKHLQEQLESIDWYMIEESSTFDIDTEHLVSETTAKEMTTVELNSYQWHRKFDGKLDKINFNLKKKDDDERKMEKVNNKLSYGQIENYIDKEDIDEKDLTDNSEYEEEEEEEKEETKYNSDNEDKKFIDNLF